MSRRDPNLLLDDIRTAIGKIEQYIRNLDKEAFLADDKTVDAVVRNLEVIGEAVRQMPEDFKQAHAQIPWGQIAGLRNRIVHVYFGLDLDLIWEIIEKDLPQLQLQLVALSS